MTMKSGVLLTLAASLMLTGVAQSQDDRERDERREREWRANGHRDNRNRDDRREERRAEGRREEQREAWQAERWQRQRAWQIERERERERALRIQRERQRARALYGRGGYYGVDPNDPYGHGVHGYGNGSNSIAYQNGYNTGFQSGIDDRNAGKSYDLNRHAHYRDGDSGYHSSFGSKAAYQQEYRAAYVRGYQQGYQSRSFNGRF